MNRGDGRASVIIPTLNRLDFLPRVLAPVLDDPATAEVVVVVDGGNDGTFEFLTEMSMNDVRIRPILQVNGGENLARSRGVREAIYDVTVILDDDVIASPRLISRHCRYHSHDSRRLVLGYMPTRIESPRLPGQVTTHLYAQDYEHTCGLYESDIDMVFTHFWAGNFSLRRDLAEKVLSRIANRVPAHGDLQFGLYCRQEGLDPIFDRSLLATHHHQRSLKKFAEQARKSGESRVALRQEFPEVIENLNPLESLSAPETLLSHTIAHPAIHAVAAPAIMTLCQIAGHLRLWSFEGMFARILRLIELVHGSRRPRTS